MTTLGPFVAWLAGALGMAALWMLIFRSVEARVSADERERNRRWFAPLDGDGKDTPNWVVNFIDIFDLTFGDRYFSLKFFLRSCLATTLIFAVMALLFIGFEVITLDRSQWFLGEGLDSWNEWQWLLLVFVSNLVADYLSLIETRVVLGMMRGGSRLRIAALVVTDTVLTALLYFVVACLLYNTEQLWQGAPDYDIYDHLNIIAGIEWGPLAERGGDWSWSEQSVSFFIIGNYVFGEEFWGSTDRENYTIYADSYRISFISTFFTSIWVWLFVLAGVLGRLFFTRRGQVTWIGRVTEVRAKPLRAVGYTLAAVTLGLNIIVYACWHVNAMATAEPPPPPEVVVPLPVLPDEDPPVAPGSGPAPEGQARP